MLGVGVALLAAVVGLIALFRSQSPDINPLANAPAPPPIQLDFPSTLPRSGGPTGYVSSASCRECHPKQHESWHRSYHRTMTQVMTTNSVLADFNNVGMEYMGERFTMTREGNEFWVQIDDLDEIEAARAANLPPPDSLHMRMGLVTGSHHMQVFWLPGGAGNMQFGFPFTWLIEDRRWVPRNDAFIRDPNVPPPKEVWNVTCIRCHVTGGQPRPDREKEIFDTRAVELGISCEACHGPAEQHVKHQRSLAELASANTSNAPDRTIIQPKDLDHVRSSQVCGFCHSIKWFDQTEGWREHGFRFRPGDDLEKTTPIVRPKQVESQPWLKNVLSKNPNLFDEFFWSDGMIRVAGREFNGLLESACHQRGKLSCLSCHSMHQSDPNDQLKRGMDSNQACLQCHTKMQDDLTAHTHHRAESSGSLCYNCHMPHTSYALLKAIRSHQIDSPNVRTTLETGRPNACNQCHLDQTLEWTARQLTEWYGQPKVELSEEQQTVAASLWWLFTGDAGQRALAAWSMGWAPAKAASGQDWQAPHLARLLDDPYSAVRYIAQRSLRTLPGFEGFEYDFIASPEDRKAAGTRALEAWNKRSQKPEATAASRILLQADGTLNVEAANKLHPKRNDRPIRLRE